MLRWYLRGQIVLLIVGAVVGFGIYRYVMQHPADPDSVVGRAYEKSIKDKLLTACAGELKEIAESDPSNTEAQVNSTCRCFANGMFEKFREVPPGELDAVIEQDATSESAFKTLKKCAYQSGLN